VSEKRREGGKTGRKAGRRPFYRRKAVQQSFLNIEKTKKQNESKTEDKNSI